MYSATPFLAELGSIEKVVITALAVAGGFMVGFVLSNVIARLLCKFVWKKEPPERMIRFVRFAGGIAVAILVYILLQGEGGLGLGGKGGGNPSNTNQGKDDNPNPPKKDETTPDPKKDEPKPKDKSIDAKTGVMVVFLLPSDSADERFYRIGNDPKPVTLEEVLAQIDAHSKKEPIFRVDIEAGSLSYSVQAATLLELKLSQRGIKSTRPTMKEPSSKND